MPESDNHIRPDQGRPRLLFDKLSGPDIVSKTYLESDNALTQGKALHCAFCHSIITWQASAIDQLGRHIHTFENPGGYEFTIGCFARAYCMQVGTPEKEWSWFPAYHWQYALCHQCHEHLGWYYRSATQSNSFFGLILDRLISAADH